jgi:hypothetical protein
VVFPFSFSFSFFFSFSVNLKLNRREETLVRHKYVIE